MIIVYTKTGCPWGIEVIDFLTKNGVAFEERNMTVSEAYKQEAILKSGQYKCPTLDIDGHILADSDAKQVGEYLKSIQVIP